MILESIALAATEKVTTDLTSSIVNEILGLQDETLELLRSVNTKVDALQHGPHQTALAYLQEAALPYRTADQVSESIRAARQELMRALGQETDWSIRSQVCLELMLTCLALNDLGAAFSYGQQGCGLLADHIDSRADKVNVQMQYDLTIRDQKRIEYRDNWFPLRWDITEELIPLVRRHNDLASAVGRLGQPNRVNLLRIVRVPQVYKYHMVASRPVVDKKSPARIDIVRDLLPRTGARQVALSGPTSSELYSHSKVLVTVKRQKCFHLRADAVFDLKLDGVSCPLIMERKDALDCTTQIFPLSPMKSGAELSEDTIHISFPDINILLPVTYKRRSGDGYYREVWIGGKQYYEGAE